MGLSILHTADLHLGMKFSSYQDMKEKLAAARFETLGGLIEIANETKCDLLVVAGDLFDRVTIAKRDVQKCLDILKGFEGQALAVLPGNHDYISGDSELWHYFKEHASDRVVLLDECREYDLEHYGMKCVLHAGPCNAKHSGENAIDWIGESSRASDQRIHIGVAHGNVAGYGPDMEGEYFPMDRRELLALGLDLWLLGHVHVPAPKEPSPDERVYYAGTPEPDGFDCRHVGSAWLITIAEDKQIEASLLRPGKYRFAHEQADLRDEAAYEELLVRFADEACKRTLLKLKLTGQLPREAFERLSDLRAAIEPQLAYVSIEDHEVSIELTADDINQEFTEGSFPHQLLSALSNDAEDGEALQLAYEFIGKARQ